MSTWRPDRPVTFADGSLGCGAHLLVFCTRCCVDYTFMQEDSDVDEDLDSDDEEEDQDENSSDSSIIFVTSLSERYIVSENANPLDYITRFSPPKDTDMPQTLFAPGHRDFVPGPRFVRHSNRDQILIYTDGACPNNGKPSATAGCAFVYGPSPLTGTVSFPLERKGPSGVIYPPTSNRAELRAVIAALQYRHWRGEGWTELVIATDSEYVALGATAWVRGWRRKGWMTKKNTPVKNRDLWELLLERIQTLQLHVLFWRIPRDWNRLADSGAKAAAVQDAPSKFCTIDLHDVGNNRLTYEERSNH